MDFRRTVGTSLMRFSSDPAAPAVRVRWFFVPDTTPVFPWPHAFGSSSYWADEREEWSDLGEEYLGGTIRVNRPGPVADPDQEPCGQPFNWANGWAWPWPNIPYNDDGTPACCFGAHISTRLRLGIGLTAAFARGNAWAGHLALGIDGAASLWAPYHWRGTLRLADSLTSVIRFWHKQLGRLNLGVHLTSVITNRQKVSARFNLGIHLSAKLPGGLQALDRLGLGIASLFERPYFWQGTLRLGHGLVADFMGQGSWGGTDKLGIGLAGVFAGEGEWGGTLMQGMGIEAVMAGFNMVTPSGGCSAMPSKVKLRITGGTGTCNCADGAECDMVYSGGSQWNGTLTCCGGNSSVVMQCSGGTYKLGSLGAQLVWGFATLTGTTGTNPNLTASISVSLGCSGGFTATITRD